METLASLLLTVYGRRPPKSKETKDQFNAVYWQEDGKIYLGLLTETGIWTKSGKECKADRWYFSLERLAETMVNE